MLVYKVLMH